MRHSILATVLILGTFGSLQAQSCDAKLSILQCYKALSFQNSAQSKTEQKPTGDAQTTGTATSIHDFLPKIAAAAVLPGLSEGVAGLSLTRNWSLDNEHTLYVPIAVQLGAKLNQPVVFQPMVEKMTSAKQPALKTRIEKTFDELDDPELSFALALENDHVGRRLERHRDELSNLVPSQLGERLPKLLAELQLIAFTVRASCGQGSNLERPLNCWPETERPKVVEVINQVIEAEKAVSKEASTWQTVSGWNRIADLINNKPQLTVRGSWRPRDAVVGPETWQGTARWEVGLVNINATRRFCKKAINGYVDGKFSPECFTRHVTSQQNLSLLQLGIRFFVQFEFKHDNKYDAPFLPVDSVTLSLPGANSWSLTGGIGGNLPSNADVQSARIDLGFAYTGADKDGVRTDKRTSITLTHTQKLSRKVSLLSGLEWSDKAEFKVEPTAKLRAKLGVRYKLITEDSSK